MCCRRTTCTKRTRRPTLERESSFAPCSGADPVLPARSTCSPPAMPIRPDDEGVSIVAPVHEEPGNLPSLVDQANEVFAACRRWEFIFVEDGSRDETPSVRAQLQRISPNLRVVRHTVKCCKTRVGSALPTRRPASAEVHWAKNLDRCSERVGSGIHANRIVVGLGAKRAEHSILA